MVDAYGSVLQMLPRVQFVGKYEGLVVPHSWLIDTTSAHAHLALAYGSLLDGAKVSIFLGNEMSDQVLAKHVFLSSVHLDLDAKLLERDALLHQLFD